MERTNSDVYENNSSDMISLIGSIGMIVITVIVMRHAMVNMGLLNFVTNNPAGVLDSAIACFAAPFMAIFNMTMAANSDIGILFGPALGVAYYVFMFKSILYLVTRGIALCTF